MDIDAKLDLIIKNLDYLTSKVTTLEKSLETLQSPYYKHPDYKSMGTTSEDPSNSIKWNASDLYSKDAMDTTIKPQASNTPTHDGTKPDKHYDNQIKEQSTKSSTSDLLRKTIENQASRCREARMQTYRDLIDENSSLFCNFYGKPIYIIL